MSSRKASAVRSTISGSNLHAGRDVVLNNEYNYSSSSSDPFALLKEHAALGALHNAAERPDPPKCHPETRTAILSRIDLWARDESHNAKPIMWLYGAAGAGKSAIAQTLIERWLRNKIVVPNFFFWRTALMRNQKTRLIPTLAFQLAKQYPMTKSIIEEAVGDGSIFKQNFTSQIQALIVNPLQISWTDTHPDHRLVVLVVDGLDECCVDIPKDLPREGDFPGQNYEDQQREILETLAFACNQIPFLRVLITSRPEREIRASFSRRLLRKPSCLLSLNNQQDVKADITLYLDCQFAEIRSRFPGIEPTWPSRGQITLLVEKSSGQFIYPSTVVKYIHRRRQYPVKSLEEVLALQPKSGNRKEHPLAELDALYTLVLKTVHHDSWDTVKTVLGIMCFFSTLFLGPGTMPQGLPQGARDNPVLPCIIQGVRQELGVAYLSGFFFFEEGELLEHLTDLHSILCISTTKAQELTFFHATLSEYLLNQSRSGEFFVGKEEVYLQVTLLLIRHAETIWPSEESPPLPQTRLPVNDWKVRSQLIGSLVYTLGNYPLSKDVASTLWHVLKQDIGGYSLIVLFDPTATTVNFRLVHYVDSGPVIKIIGPVLDEVGRSEQEKLLRYLQRCNIPSIEPSESHRNAVETHLSYILHRLRGPHTQTAHFIRELRWIRGRTLHMFSGW